MESITITISGMNNEDDMRAVANAIQDLPHIGQLDLSLEAASDRSLVAEDGLHPSGVQYGRWLERIVPAVRELLAD